MRRIITIVGEDKNSSAQATLTPAQIRLSPRGSQIKRISARTQIFAVGKGKANREDAEFKLSAGIPEPLV
jgi:hypothetical protein